tara:strand:- start:31 stop:639 length:609 start_codon:yes stop_codon:yes gene_type:complete
MGRVLKTTGSVGSGSGVSTSDVTTLITTNTPWQYIETLTANSSSQLDFTNSNIANFDAFYIHFDNLNFSTQTQARMRLFLNNETSVTGNSNYSYSSTIATNSSQSTDGNNGTTYWQYGGSSYPWMVNLTGTMYINGKVGNTKVMKSNISGGNSGSSTIRMEAAGHYSTTSHKPYPITGFRFFNNSGTFTDGQLHLYGLNKHD